MTSLFKKSLFSGSALLLAFFFSNYAFAATVNMESVDSSRWATGFCHNFTLVNTTAKPVSGWKIRFDLPGATMGQPWNVTSTEVTKGTFEFTAAGWNGQIPTNGSVSMWFCADGTGSVTNPVLTFSDVNPPPPPPSNYNKDFTVTDQTVTAHVVANSDWGSGYCRAIDIKNNGTWAVSWSMKFSLDSTVVWWGAKFANSGSQYAITPETWTNSVAPGTSVSYGFCVTSANRDSVWSITKLDIFVPPPPPVPINGLCGSDNGKTLSAAPTNLCSAGLSTAVSWSGPWTWICQGQNWGSNASCRAEKTGLPPPPPVSGSGLSYSAYYPDWKTWSSPSINTDVPKFAYTIQAFASVTSDWLISVPYGFTSNSPLKVAHDAGKKVLVSIEWAFFNTYLAQTSVDPVKRAKFVRSVTDFVTTNGYDGVDIDWEFPYTSTESAAFVSLIHDLKTAMPGKTITAAIPITASYHMVDAVAMANEADYLFVMAYELEWWTGYAGYNAPLYPNRNMPTDMSIATLMQQEFFNKNVPPSKLVLGFPLYGKKFLTSKPYQSAGYGEAVEYRDLPFSNCTRNFDSESKVPYLSCGSYYISYDDTESLQAKADYAKSKNLGGIFLWALGSDAGVITGSLPSSATGSITQNTSGAGIQNSLLLTNPLPNAADSSANTSQFSISKLVRPIWKNEAAVQKSVKLKKSLPIKTSTSIRTPNIRKPRK